MALVRVQHLPASSRHLADLVLNNDGLVLLDDEAAGTDEEPVLYGLKVRIFCFKADLDDC